MAESPVRWQPTDESYPPGRAKPASVEEASSEGSGFLSPAMMGLLSAGASIMRNSGWRNTPITAEEQFGYAIPAGVNAYYEQQERDRLQQQQQEQQAQAQAQQQALAQQQAQEAEQNRLQAEAEAEQKKLSANEFNNILLDAKTNKKITGEQQRMWLKQYAEGDQKGAFTAFNKALESKEGKTGDTFRILSDEEAVSRNLAPETTWQINNTSYKITELQKNTVPNPTETLGEEQIAKLRQAVPSIVAQVTNYEVLPEHEREAFAIKYAYPETMTDEQLQTINSDFATLVQKYGEPPEKSDKKYYGDMGLEHPDASAHLEEAGYPSPGELKVKGIEKIEVKRDSNGNINIVLFDVNGKTVSEVSDKAVSSKTAKTYNRKNFLAIPEYKNLELDPRIKNIEVGVDNRLKFMNASGNAIPGLKTMQSMRLNERGQTESWLINKLTGADIRKIGIAKLTPLERVRFNQESVDKKVRQEAFEEFLAMLEQDYGIEATYITKLRNQSIINFDKAFKDANDLYNKNFKESGDVRRGSSLLKDPNYEGANFDENKTYVRDGAGWKELLPEDRQGADGLRKEYNRLTRDFRVAARGHDGVMKGLTSDTGLGDIMAITSFRIMFEPNSVVREAEFEITSKAGGAWENIKNIVEKYTKGDRLTPEVRNQMATLVNEYMMAVNRRATKHYGNYTDIAKTRGYKDNANIQHPFSTYDFYKAGAKGSGGNSNSDNQKDRASTSNAIKVL